MVKPFFPKIVNTTADVLRSDRDVTCHFLFEPNTQSYIQNMSDAKKRKEEEIKNKISRNVKGADSIRKRCT